MTKKKPETEKPEEAKPGPLKYSEERLARLIGFERDQLRLRRGALGEGHWGRELGHIAYDEHAVKLMMRTFGLEAKDAGHTWPKLLQQVVIDKPKLADTEVKVMRAGRNRGLLAGIRMEDEERVTVRVRDNSLFTPGMVLDCVHVRSNQYEYIGRLPRTRGRW